MRTLLSVFTLAAAALALPLQASATPYFVKVDAPAGNDGTSWEKAFNLADVITAISTKALQNGDDVYFAGGTYYYPEQQASGNPLLTGIKLQNIAINLHGGYPADLTGTATPELTYPTATPTVLNGDTNRNGVNDDGDLRNLIFVQTTKEATDLLQADRSILIEGFTLTGAYYNGSKGNELGALNVDMTQTVTVRHCVFTGNKCVNAGAAAANSGSRTRFIDCVFSDNEGKDAGIAVNMSKRGDADKYFKPAVTVERCEISGNRAVGEGSVAGGSAIRVNAGSLYILNSTITGNTGYKQGAIHLNSDTYLYIGSSTIADNDMVSPAYGSAVYAKGKPHIRAINSYILGIADDDANPVMLVNEMTTKVSDVFTSDGANVIGTSVFFGEEGSGFQDNFADVIIPDYDFYGDKYTAKSVFGTAGPVDKGGFSKVLVPLEVKRVYSKTDFAGVYKSEYKCPYDVDDTVDQLGTTRPDKVAIGAYDPTGTDGIADITGEAAQSLQAIALGGGVYQLSATVQTLAVYNLSGALVARGTDTAVVDLSAAPAGVYIVRTDAGTVKIVK